MAAMGPWSRVRAAKCQMLVTSFFVLLLGLSMATLAALTYFGAHFAVIGRASSDRTPYEAMHRWAFYVGISLAGLLTLGAILGAAATVREAGGLMAGGFLCFALVFGALVQVAFWRFHNPTQVEDALLDAYDLLYDRAVKNLSGTPRQQLLAIQDTFLCCGKSSPFSLLGDVEAGLCRGEQAARQVRRGGQDLRSPSLASPGPQPPPPTAGLLEAAVRAGLGPLLPSLFHPLRGHACPRKPPEAHREEEDRHWSGGGSLGRSQKDIPRKGQGGSVARRARKSLLPHGPERGLAPPPASPPALPDAAALPAPLPRCPGNKPTPISGREAPGCLPRSRQEDANGSWPRREGWGQQRAQHAWRGLRARASQGEASGARQQSGLSSVAFQNGGVPTVKATERGCGC
ncbi:tetraspanin-32 isoform X1 [Zalophus californianus]|uniref:Tetraspanin-32 isoform X1 n=1 Tax=Zalophus californianus TaxID=9704 RepID=A0A6J2BNK5_ZALCA|nr:tetraspanin-32 isoform X1 [Zalophus californianus]